MMESLEPLAELLIADSTFLGFCFEPPTPAKFSTKKPTTTPQVLIYNGSQDCTATLKAIWACVRYNVTLETATKQDLPAGFHSDPQKPALIYGRDIVLGGGGNAMCKAIALLGGATISFEEDEWCEIERTTMRGKSLINKTVLQSLATALEASTTKIHLVGESLSTADICVLATLSKYAKDQHTTWPVQVQNYYKIHTPAMQHAKETIQTYYPPIQKWKQLLQQQYPSAAHIAMVWKFGSIEGWDEDGEPPESCGPGMMKEFKISKTTNNKRFAIAIVRMFGQQLLGVTCGRLTQCYQSIVRATLHRHFTSKTTPFELELLKVDKSVYGLGAGDCELILNVVQDPNGNLAEQVKEELDFGGFKGAAGEVLPRLQNLQADLSNNIIPVYRYPGNYTGDEWETFDWSPTSLEIKKAVEEQLLIPQIMNHCVTNYYRDGNDFIAHHSDKDLDLNRSGVIVSVSLGDDRILELRRRTEPHDITRIILPQRSMLVLGPKTNKQFSHSILPKKDSTKARISLTLRDVKTFMDLNTGRLFGQGVKHDSLAQLRSRTLMEDSILFSTFCAFSALMMMPKGRGDKAISSTNAHLIWTGVFATSTYFVRAMAYKWYRRQEEDNARDFFSKSSLSGTKY